MFTVDVKQQHNNNIPSTIQSTPSITIGFMTLLCNYIYVRRGISFDELAAVLQIIRGNTVNFEIIIHIFIRTYFVTNH